MAAPKEKLREALDEYVDAIATLTQQFANYLAMTRQKGMLPRGITDDYVAELKRRLELIDWIGYPDDGITKAKLEWQ